MIKAISDFISQLTFVQAQILIAEIVGSICVIILVVALLPRISGAKKINIKTGETEYYDDGPTKTRTAVKRKSVK